MARDRAESARDEILNMTVSAFGKAAGTEPSVAKSIQNNVVHLTFGIPRGADGGGSGGGSEGGGTASGIEGVSFPRHARGEVVEFDFEGDNPVAIYPLRVYFTPHQAGTGDPSAENIRPISGYVTMYLRQTVDGNTRGDIGMMFYYGSSATSMTPVYGGWVDPLTKEFSSEWAMIDSYAGEELPGEWISDRDVYAEETTPTAGAQVCYKLAEEDYETGSLRYGGGWTLYAEHGHNTIYAEGADGKSSAYLTGPVVDLVYYTGDEGLVVTQDLYNVQGGVVTYDAEKIENVVTKDMYNQDGGVPSYGTFVATIDRVYDEIWDAVDEIEGGGGASDYDDLTGKPSVNGVTLTGNKTSADLGLADAAGTTAALAEKVDKEAGKGLFSGAYADLTGKPDLFSGAYADLTGKPELFSGAYADLTGKPDLFTGAYADLTGKPSIGGVTLEGNVTLPDIGAVPVTRTVAGKPLSSDVTLAKADVGLGNVDNTADADKPVSTAQQAALDRKVDKVTGKGLSTEDYTTAEKTKLAGIPADATANQGTVTGITMNGASKGTSGVVDLGTVLTEHQDISGKVDKVTGKGLSTNDFTNAYKEKLDGAITTDDIGVTGGVMSYGVDMVDWIAQFTPGENHRNWYGGRNLGSDPTAYQSVIADGSFQGLLVGDYWRINNVNWRIVDVDYWYATGDSSFNRHHLVIMPDSAIATAKMNDTNTTEGGYVGSKMYTDTLPTVKTTCEAAFPGMILTHRECLVSAVTNGKPSAAVWANSSVELPSEIMMYGSNIIDPGNDGETVASLYTIDKQQLALFNLVPRFISASAGFWLRDPVSATTFASMDGNGRALHGGTSVERGVRPVFAVG